MTSGQINYERFAEVAGLARLPGGVPPFDKLPARIQTAWEEAAKAVVVHDSIPPTCPELEAAEPASEP